MWSILTILIGFLLILSLLLIIDTILLKNSFKSSLNRITTFYDGLKTFIVVNIVDKLFTSSDDSESDSDLT
jgi:hypothetical protein